MGLVEKLSFRQLQQRPQLILQGALKIVLNQGKDSRPE